MATAMTMTTIDTNLSTSKALSSATPVWGLMAVYVVVQALGQPFLVAEPVDRIRLPVAAFKLFFPTRPIDLMVLALLVLAAVRHALRMRSAIPAPRAPFQHPWSRDGLAFGWSITWPLQLAAVLVTYGLMFGRVSTLSVPYLIWGFALAIPFAALLARHRLSSFSGVQGQVAWGLLWRCAWC